MIPILQVILTAAGTGLIVSHFYNEMKKNKGGRK